MTILKIKNKKKIARHQTLDQKNQERNDIPY